MRIVRATGEINYGIWKNSSVDTTDVIFSKAITNLIKAGEKYQSKIRFDGSGYYLKLSVNGGDFEDIYKFETETKIMYNPIFYFGKATTYAAPDVTMDLKEFAVTVDGKEVLNGNASRLATCTYTEYAEDLATYGQCAKFAVDEENGTFRVPTIKDGAYITQALTAEEIGKSYNESLPNITGTFSAAQDAAPTGVFQTDTTGHVPYAKGDWYSNITSFDAARSSSAYHDGAKVQGDNVRLRYFVVVATGAINQSEMDWSEWATSLQGKANTDFSNCTKTYIDNGLKLSFKTDNDYEIKKVIEELTNKEKI